MIKTKNEFIKSFLPNTISDVEFIQLNLDVTDLSIPDILRNLNKMYPLNSRVRNAIISGTTAIAILCKTDTLDPLKGLFILVTNDDIEFEMYSSNYIVLSISENNIRTTEALIDVIDRITRYLAKNEFNDYMFNLHNFYRKFVYNEDEMDEGYAFDVNL